jgi:hypothetical protein
MRSLLIALAASMIATSAGADEASPVAQQVTPLLQKFVATVDALPAYTVVMSQQQRIGGEIRPAETLLMKHRRSPECRYLKWIAPPHQDRELITCNDRDSGQLHVHQPGLFGIPVTLSPDNPIVTHGNLRPLAQSGLFNMARLIADEGRRREAQRISNDLPTLTERNVDEQASLCMHRDHAIADDADKAPYTVGASELCLDKTSAMPTEVQFWDSAGQLMEHYRFRDYQLDAPLADSDFDTRNPDYHF